MSNITGTQWVLIVFVVVGALVGGIKLTNDYALARAEITKEQTLAQQEITKAQTIATKEIERQEVEIEKKADVERTEERSQFWQKLVPWGSDESEGAK